MLRNRVINIDSLQRDKQKYPSSTKYRLQLQEPLQQVSYIRLSSIELPNIFYTFNKRENNTNFKLVFIKDSIKYEHTIEIDEGNYKASSLIIIIRKQLDNINSDIGDLTIVNFTIEFEQNTYKILIKNDATNPIEFSLFFENYTDYQSLGYILGYRKNSYIDETEYKAESVYYILGSMYIFLKVNDYGRVYLTSNQAEKSLAKVLLTQQKTNIVFDNSSNYLTKTHIFDQTTTIYYFSIELVDRLNNTIDLQDLDFSCTLEIGYNPIQHNQSMIEFY